MAEYNWDDLELKYFGHDYKAMDPKDKVRVMWTNHLPLSKLEKELFNRGLEKLDENTAIEIYRNLIMCLDEAPAALEAVRKVLKKYKA